MTGKKVLFIGGRMSGKAAIQARIIAEIRGQGYSVVEWEPGHKVATLDEGPWRPRTGAEVIADMEAYLCRDEADCHPKMDPEEVERCRRGEWDFPEMPAAREPSYKQRNYTDDQSWKPGGNRRLRVR